jgi:NADPH:quinone reductase-like Zn-dependent oxidoreductase
LPAGSAVPVPDGISDEIAASAMMQGLRAGSATVAASMAVLRRHGTLLPDLQGLHPE